MAEPFYLQGSQTAGLFQQPSYPQQTPYSPGQGMPLYANSSVPSIGTTNSFDSSNWDQSNQAPMGAFDGGRGLQSVGEIDAYWRNIALNAQQPQQQSGFTNISQDGLGWGENARKVTSMLGGGTSAGGTAGKAASAGAITSGGSSNVASGAGRMGSSVQFQGNGATQLPNGVPGNMGSFQMGQANPQNYMPGQQPQQQAANGLLGMQQAGPQGPMNQYMNTAGYQLTEGQGAVDRFQESPGYQYAVDQAMSQVQGNMASRGLLDSGRALQSMTDRAHQLGNQEWNNWQNRQQQMYNGYQNRLQGLAGGPTGADYAMQTGQGMAGNAMQTGSNMGNLLGGQGNAGMSAGINTGAAQSGNIMTAGNQQAQILGANSTSQLSGAIQGLF